MVDIKPTWCPFHRNLCIVCNLIYPSKIYPSNPENKIHFFNVWVNMPLDDFLVHINPLYYVPISPKALSAATAAAAEQVLT